MTSRKGGRADECVGLENRCGETHRGFESHPFHHSGVAQMAEQLTVNQLVIGSIPIAGAFSLKLCYNKLTLKGDINGSR